MMPLQLPTMPAVDRARDAVLRRAQRNNGSTHSSSSSSSSRIPRPSSATSSSTPSAARVVPVIMAEPDATPSRRSLVSQVRDKVTAMGFSQSSVQRAMQTLSTQDYRTLPTSALVRAVLGRLTSDAHSVASSIPSPSTGGRGAGTATGAGAGAGIGAGIGAGGGGVTSSRRRRQRRRSARGTDTIPDVVQLASSDDDDYLDGASSAASSSTFEDSDEEQVRVPLRGHTGGAGGAAGAAAGGTGHYWGHRRRAPPGASNNNSMQQLGGRRQTADAGQFVSSRDRRGGHRAHSEIESDDEDGVDVDDDDADLHPATTRARGDASSLTSMWLHTDSEMVLGTINESTKSSGDFWWPLEDMVTTTTIAFTTYPPSPPHQAVSRLGSSDGVQYHWTGCIRGPPHCRSGYLGAVSSLR